MKNIKTNDYLSKKLKMIKHRCNYVKASGYKYYGGKGIKCLITIEDLKYLWRRDGGYNLQEPSIDRIDSNKNYELSNCRFIEFQDNRRRGNITENRYKISETANKIQLKNISECEYCGKEGLYFYIYKKNIYCSDRCVSNKKLLNFIKRYI